MGIPPTQVRRHDVYDWAPELHGGHAFMTTLEEHIRWLAATPVLLVACDFDGTWRRSRTRRRYRAERRSVRHAELASLGTHAAVISGERADLRVFQDPADLLLVGSHGAENPLASEARQRRRTRSNCWPASRGRSRPRPTASRAPGPRPSPGRRGSLPPGRPAAAADLTSRLSPSPPKLEGVRLLRGKKVVEFVIGGGDRGARLLSLRHRTGATAALFIGDDVTDEDAFEVLTRHDLGVKVGTGDTRPVSASPIPPPSQTQPSNCSPSGARWLASRRLAIDRHWLLSDQRACAGRPDGPAWSGPASRDWIPPPLFAELLGRARSGFWEIVAADCPNQPEDSAETESFVVQTRWPSCAGHARRYAVPSARRDGLPRRQRRTRVSSVRVAPTSSGPSAARAEPSFGSRASTSGVSRPDSGCAGRSGAHRIARARGALRAGCAVEDRRRGPRQTAIAEIVLNDHWVVFELRWGTGSLPRRAALEPDRRVRRRSSGRPGCRASVRRPRAGRRKGRPRTSAACRAASRSSAALC